MNTNTSVKIIEDSINSEGNRITTFQLRYWRAIHAELMTHRVFSRNASSSRAIPVNKMIEQVRTDPAGPIHWGANQPGMQASMQLEEAALNEAHLLWGMAANNAADIAEEMSAIGLHKQVANRILEPFQYISVVLTATEFDNWFDLRAHADAQPEIQVLAREMLSKRNNSKPIPRIAGEWHLPYTTLDDCILAMEYLKKGRITRDEPRNEEIVDVLKKLSAARCCRVSYLKHDGSRSSIEEDIALCDRLAGSVPIHASPFEHQATPDVFHHQGWEHGDLHGNFKGWIQNRKLIEATFNN